MVIPGYHWNEYLCWIFVSDRGLALGVDPSSAANWVGF